MTPQPCGLHPGPPGASRAPAPRESPRPSLPSGPQHVGSSGPRQWHRSARWVPVPAATEMLVPVGRREAGWCVFINPPPGPCGGQRGSARGRWALGLRPTEPRLVWAVGGPPAWPRPRQDPAGSPQLGLHPRPLPGPPRSPAVPEAFLMLFHETRVLNPELWPRSGRSTG